MADALGWEVVCPVSLAVLLLRYNNQLSIKSGLPNLNNRSVTLNVVGFSWINSDQPTLYPWQMACWHKGSEKVDHCGKFFVCGRDLVRWTATRQFRLLQQIDPDLLRATL